MGRPFSSDNERQLALLIHDLRNVLVIIHVHTQLVQRRLKCGGQVDGVVLERSLSAIEEVVGQATRRLSDFDSEVRQRPDGARTDGDERSPPPRDPPDRRA
jgi:hypothetical protein